MYDTAAHADAAVRDLKAANIPSDSISQHAKGSGSHASAPQHQGFWASLFGAEPDHDTSVYDTSIESGSTVVTVKAPEPDYARVSAILEKHNPIDLDERTARYGESDTANARTTTGSGMGKSANDGGTIQLADETLSVGKRAVSGGTTRIRRYVVETPVQEQVNLRSEKVTIERRPVTDGRTVGNADFTDKTIEMTETSEEAVVAKTARVKEEVRLRKESTDRVVTVKDTVRRDEVKVEKVPESKDV